MHQGCVLLVEVVGEQLSARARWWVLIAPEISALCDAIATINSPARLAVTL
jgi:hypothetical protein